MIKKYKKEDIERWQRRFYIPSGDGIHYIHVCEICHNSNSIMSLPGGHYVCECCKKKLRLPKEDTIIKWGNNGIKSFEQLNLKNHHPSEGAKKERIKVWKKIIRMDYLIELYNKNFDYDY